MFVMGQSGIEEIFTHQWNYNCGKQFHNYRPNFKLKGPVYLKNCRLIRKIETVESEHSAFADKFRKVYQKSKVKKRYKEIADETKIPPELIAAIHCREEEDDYLKRKYKVYLHNGDPLGKKTVSKPHLKKIFYKFKPAAIHALKAFNGIRKKLKLNKKSKDIIAMAPFAEYYNGVGYNENPSSYIFSGTNVYKGGKYTSDGVYDPDYKDKQTGILILIDSIL